MMQYTQWVPTLSVSYTSNGSVGGWCDNVMVADTVAVRIEM